MHAANTTPIRDARDDEVLCGISAVPVNGATAITDQHTSRAYHSRSGAHSREILRL